MIITTDSVNWHGNVWAVWQLFFLLIITNFRKLVFWVGKQEASQRKFNVWVSVISSFSKVKGQPFGSPKPKVLKLRLLEGLYKIKPCLQWRVSAAWNIAARNDASQVLSAVKHHKYYKKQPFFCIHLTNTSFSSSHNFFFFLGLILQRLDATAADSSPPKRSRCFT